MRNHHSNCNCMACRIARIDFRLETFIEELKAMKKVVLGTPEKCEADDMDRAFFRPCKDAIPVSSRDNCWYPKPLEIVTVNDNPPGCSYNPVGFVLMVEYTSLDLGPFKDCVQLCDATGLKYRIRACYLRPATEAERQVFYKDQYEHEQRKNAEAEKAKPGNKVKHCSGHIGRYLAQGNHGHTLALYNQNSDQWYIASSVWINNFYVIQEP